MSPEIYGTGGAFLTDALDLIGQRQRVSAADLANVNTPGYRAKDLAFDDELQRAEIVERKGVSPRDDGNTVKPEIEIGALRKNALVYRVFLQAMVHKTRMVRTAIQGHSS